MNWLGKLIQEYVKPTDIVLDLGCGIMQATTDSLGTLGNEGNLVCKTILGVDVHQPYLDRIKGRYPTLRLDVRRTDVFVDDSYDVVLCTDVLEHLPKPDALRILAEMERIARKYVIAYTPAEFHDNDEHVHEAWGMTDNEQQRHLSLVSQSEFKKFGYRIKTTDIDHNTLAVKRLGGRP